MLAISFIVLNYGDRSTYYYLYFLRVHLGGITHTIEYTGVVSQLLKDAKRDKGDMVVLWLDLKKSYEWILHRLVEEALKRHHVPNKIIELIEDY